jgi:hypothetical protein
LARGVLLFSPPAYADGGAVRLQQTAGPYTITLFTPEPLRAGTVDASVLVQSTASGEVVLDAEVALEVEGRSVTATHEAATNKLLYAALIEFAEAGSREVAVDVVHAGSRQRVSGRLQVAPASPPLASLWPYLALPAVAVALFGVRQWLAGRRRER